MGLGKTFVALAAAKILAPPKTLVVCPKTIIPTWKRAAEYLGVAIEVINYEKVRTGRTPFGTWETVKSRKVFKWALPTGALIVFDEAHRLGGMKTKNADLLTSAVRQGYMVDLLSGTLAHEPNRLKAIGFALKLHRLSDFWPWLATHGYTETQFGWQFTCGMSYYEQVRQVGELARRRRVVMERIHDRIYKPGLGVRLRKSDIPDFPECQTDVVAVEFDTDNITSVYDEMKAEMEALGAKRNSFDQRVIMLRARQRAELLKVPGLVEMIEDAVDNGQSVAVFLNFTDSLKALQERLSRCVVVAGGQTPEVRDASIMAFQNDEVPVILCNIQAGGVGISLHDVRGVRSRLALILPTFNPVDLLQALGRIWRAGAKSKAWQRILFAAGTIEESAMDSVGRKIWNIEAVNDGDLCAGLLPSLLTTRQNLLVGY